MGGVGWISSMAPAHPAMVGCPSSPYPPAPGSMAPAHPAMVGFLDFFTDARTLFHGPGAPGHGRFALTVTNTPSAVPWPRRTRPW